MVQLLIIKFFKHLFLLTTFSSNFILFSLEKLNFSNCRQSKPALHFIKFSRIFPQMFSSIFSSQYFIFNFKLFTESCILPINSRKTFNNSSFKFLIKNPNDLNCFFNDIFLNNLLRVFEFDKL